MEEHSKFAHDQRETMIDFTLAAVTMTVALAFISYLLIASFVDDPDPLLVCPGGLIGFATACIIYRRQQLEP